MDGSWGATKQPPWRVPPNQGLLQSTVLSFCRASEGLGVGLVGRLGTHLILGDKVEMNMGVVVFFYDNFLKFGAESGQFSRFFFWDIYEL